MLIYLLKKEMNDKIKPISNETTVSDDSMNSSVKSNDNHKAVLSKIMMKPMLIGTYKHVLTWL